MSNTGTAILMVVFFVVFVGIDIWLDRDKRSGNTYSERMRALGKLWPPFRLLIVFGMGLLCGHWWWTPSNLQQ